MEDFHGSDSRGKYFAMGYITSIKTVIELEKKKKQIKSMDLKRGKKHNHKYLSTFPRNVTTSGKTGLFLSAKKSPIYGLISFYSRLVYFKFVISNKTAV